MSEVIEGAVNALGSKLDGASVGGTVKISIEGEGTILVDDTGARAGDGDADVTLSADAGTFSGILDGDVDATAAFMSGTLSIDGDMGIAMKLANALS